MSIYVDASFAVSLFVLDANSEAASAWMDANPASDLVASVWTDLETLAMITKLEREGAITSAEAQAAAADYDVWRASLGKAQLLTPDLDRALQLVRSRELALRAPDALHFVIAERLQAGLLTFDKQLRRVAAARGLSVHPI